MTTKQYLRFSSSDVFSVVASSSANIQRVEENESKDNLFVVPACENICVWNLHSKEQVTILNGDKSAVSCLSIDPRYKTIAGGYIDGSIRLFDLKTSSCIVSFIGHKSAVSCLTFEEDGSNLASGGKDSEIVMWNIVDQGGLFRLKGHKGSITQLRFIKSKNFLISSSKDTFLKFWDLETQHCFYTLVGSRNEILDFALIKETKLIVGVNNANLKVWNINFSSEDFSDDLGKKRMKTGSDFNGYAVLNNGEVIDEAINLNENLITPVEIGELITIDDRTNSVVVDPSERLLGAVATTKRLQLYKILNEAEHNKKIRKRRNKDLKNKRDDDEEEVVTETGITDDFQSLKPLFFPAKIVSANIYVERNDIAKITVILKNNSIHQYQLDLKLKAQNSEMHRSISLPGHSSTIQTLSYSTDAHSILSTCDQSIKIWKSFEDKQKCTNSIPCDSCLCSLLVTGNNHCIIGTKTGKLNIFDINAVELLESIDAHEGSVNCIASFPNSNGIVSGGKDQDIKFWDFELVKSDNDFKKRLSLTHTRTLKMLDQIICLAFSQDNKKIAISLLDKTVQVLFTDSLKLAFSLYGHALPVTCMDISFDGTLIATGSEDKDIRIWSMEFGSCNKFLKRAHDKGITCLRFLPKSHLFFSGGRDNVIKEWDADNFQKIITLKGHQHEITAMTVSPDGYFVVTASKDNSIRMWEKTSEPLVLQEEQENEREEDDRAEDLPVIPGEINKEVALSGMKTMETINSVDQLIEALRLYDVEMQKLEDYKLESKASGKDLPPVPLHPLFAAYNASSPLDYMRKVFKKIKPSELEGTLLYLPFNYVLDVFKIISEFVEKGWEIELSAKCVTFLVRIHFGQILSSKNFQPVIEKLKEKLFSQLYDMRDAFGFVKYVSLLQQKAIEAREDVTMFSGILKDVKKKRPKKKTHSVITFV